MGIELAKAFISVHVDNQQLGPGMDGVRNTVERTFSKLTSVVGSFKQAIFGAAAGMYAFQGVQAAGQFEQTTIAFNTMLGSVKETEQTMKDLTDFAAKTPFEMPGILNAARGLIQFGERGEELMDTLKFLGDASAATSTDFGFLALVFNQVRGVGKLLTQDFRQLSTRGIISLQDIAKYYKTTTSEAQKMLSSGSISFEDFRKIMKGLAEEGGRFNNMMEKQSQSLLGLWSTLTDQWNILKRQIGTPIAEMLKPLLTVSIKLLEVFSELVGVFLKTPIFDVMISGFNTLAGTINLVLSPLSKLLNGFNKFYDDVKKKVGEGLEIAFRNLMPGGSQNALGKEIADSIFGSQEEAFREIENKSQEALKALSEKQKEQLMQGVTVAQPYMDALQALQKYKGEAMDTYTKIYTKHSKLIESIKEEGRLSSNTAANLEMMGDKVIPGLGIKWDTLVARVQKHYEVTADVAEHMLKTGKVTAEEFDKIIEGTKKVESVGFAGQLQAIEEQLPKTTRPIEEYVNTLDSLMRASENAKGAGAGLINRLRGEIDTMTGFTAALQDANQQLKTLQGWTSQQFAIQALADAGSKTKQGLAETKRQVGELQAVYDKINKLTERKELKSQADQLAKGLMTPLEKFRQEAERIEKMRSQGLITADVYNRALDQAAESLAQHQMQMEETQGKMQNLILRATEGRMAVTEMHNRIQDALIKKDVDNEQLISLKEQIKNQQIGLKKQDDTIKAIKNINTSTAAVLT